MCLKEDDSEWRRATAFLSPVVNALCINVSWAGISNVLVDNRTENCNRSYVRRAETDQYQLLLPVVPW